MFKVSFKDSFGLSRVHTFVIYSVCVTRPSEILVNFVFKQIRAVSIYSTGFKTVRYAPHMKQSIHTSLLNTFSFSVIVSTQVAG